MNYLHVCWLCSSEFHFALAFDVVVAASCFLLRIQKHLSREILPHTLEVKRSSRSQPDLIFCSNILSSGHHSSQLAISYKIQYHIQQQQHSSAATEPTTKLSTIKGFSPFFLYTLLIFRTQVKANTLSKLAYWLPTLWLNHPYLPIIWDPFQNSAVTLHSLIVHVSASPLHLLNILVTEPKFFTKLKMWILVNISVLSQSVMCKISRDLE